MEDKYYLLGAYVFYLLAVLFGSVWGGVPAEYPLYFMMTTYTFSSIFLVLSVVLSKGWIKNVMLTLLVANILYLLFISSIPYPEQGIFRVLAVLFVGLAAVETARNLITSKDLSNSELLVGLVITLISLSTQSLVIIIEAGVLMLTYYIAKNCPKTWLVKGIWGFVVPFSLALLANIAFSFKLIDEGTILFILSVISIMVSSLSAYFFLSLAKVEEFLGRLS